MRARIEGLSGTCSCLTVFGSQVACWADQPAGPALEDVVRRHRSLGRRPSFPGRRSRSTAPRDQWRGASRPSRFFSRAFSDSRAFRRRASDTSIPPNFAFHLKNVVWLIP
jgi:hypothetical protein